MTSPRVCCRHSATHCGYGWRTLLIVATAANR
jgi:hypothetical protein